MEKYDRLRVLGEGSFGKVRCGPTPAPPRAGVTTARTAPRAQVYLVRHKALRRLFAMKMVRLHNVPAKERFVPRRGPRAACPAA